MKKTFAALMIITMIMCFMPMAAFAGTDYEARIGEISYVTLDAAVEAAENEEKELTEEEAKKKSFTDKGLPEDFDKWDPQDTASQSCWGGAKKACADIGMSLPDRATLEKIAAQRSNYPDLPQSGIFWSSSELITNDAYNVNFSLGNTDYNGKYGHYGALCLGD